jgi:hypothetical protein
MKFNLSTQISLSHVSKKLYCPDDVFELSRVTQLEQIRTTIYETNSEGSIVVAKRIAS